ncbi:uncharacterized protein BCR38DRAFT_408268 [Pseudomassariella vexata]|uniref:TEA domain-containing protein n=1 Tax=Pseudomassariella vexata TaxID=1141098 RepID=A0A1Y2E4V0_9PEZI|nr:uncharacterized protein BCR38DRAFT_408268 [Pseudomassariella vexata]ORY66316.1 hypothetical protein BCR38DRAFT_408268 [Pseudomassariella vexata]
MANTTNQQKKKLQNKVGVNKVLAIVEIVTRQSLGESTGNVQPLDFGSLALCQSSHLPPSPSLQSIPKPPIVPAQAVISTYGTSSRDYNSFPRDLSLHESPITHSRHGTNPIYSWKHFADYRAKVTQKEAEKNDPTLPLYLEDAFLDSIGIETQLTKAQALLLIPLIGRKKLSSKGVLYGRNMLITEYLWIYHRLLYPPQPGEIMPIGKAREDHPMYRTRKQASSHIQVLKGFFLTHPLFHFFFPRENEEKEEYRKHIKEEGEEIDAFKNHKVLIALAEGRLPDQQPNYDYFARLLAGDSEVFVRPKTCWIHASSSEVSLTDDCKNAYANDRTCLSADTTSLDGTRLGRKGDVPHLIRNSDKETRRDLDKNQKEDDPPKYLLHEYTKSIAQKESKSMRDISKKFCHRFPKLYEKLMAALNDTHHLDERTSRCVVGPCDLIQFEVVLDLHTTSRFPNGTHLDGTVELQICHPELSNHHWRSITSIIKPKELEYNDTEEPIWDCITPCPFGSRQKDVLVVPFPATSWANSFIRLADYVAAEKARMNCRPGYPKWTRRSVILWTFQDANNKINDKGKIDPTSTFHQQRAYVDGSPRVSQDSAKSMKPDFAHHLNAAMHENFDSAHETTSITSPSQQHTHLDNLHLLDSFSLGYLTTPPPTASLPSSYTYISDDKTINDNDSLHRPSFLSDPSASGTESQGNMLADLGVPFLANLGPISSNAYDNVADCDGGLQGLEPVSQWGTKTCVAHSQQWNRFTCEGSTGLAAETTGLGGPAANIADVSPWHDMTSRDQALWAYGNDTLWGARETNDIKQSHNAGTVIHLRASGRFNY